MNFNYLNGFLVPKLYVIQITDPFEILFFYGKGMIAKRLNKLNRRSELAVPNGGVTDNVLKFNGRSSKATNKV